MALENDAEEKFWETPELLEMLLPFLDVASTLCLAQAHFSSSNLESQKDSVVLGVLQRPLVWNKLIERSLPGNQYETHEEDMLETMKTTVEFLTEILKTFNGPVSLEMDLLLFICKRFPQLNYGFYVRPQHVHLSHHLPPDQFWTRSVSPLGFTLLESVESSLGTAKQKIERIQVDILREPWLSAFGGRASRQGRKIGEFKCWEAECDTKEIAEALFILLNHCQSWTVRRLGVEEGVGPDGWKALREAICSPGATRPLESVEAPLRVMIEGRREDLRAIWEAVANWIIVNDAGYNDHGKMLYSEIGWRRLEVLMDMKKEVVEKDGLEEEVKGQEEGKQE